ncbi:hypothetical protein [Sphingomonas sp. LM7]|uniref:hypothetical protein n=1 Tax=Sphingomonas sp. LM7 TaxID=1938607 RepID=UPI000984013D|nr:hypothetical protein [Sphingomonas sp. LM7]AQR72509.1 hypothetical protein BXU08_01455 [Sphingomonas sp. LM7]
MATASDPVRFSVFSSLAGRIARPLRLAAVAWVAVFTVLVCAVVPAGLPHTAAQGSAFNPATTSVALQAKAPQARMLVKRLLRRDAGDTPVVQPSAVFPAAMAMLAPPTRAEGNWIARAATARLAAPVRALPWARGPPLA